MVSVERAREQAEAGRGGQTGDVRWSAGDELRLLVTHGTLHICGWDHAEPGGGSGDAGAGAAAAGAVMTASRFLGLVAVTTIAVGLVSCGGAGSGSQEPGASAAAPGGPALGEIRYSCGGPPGFLPGLLDEPPAAELENHPTAAALRASIQEVGMDIDMLPLSGYWLVHRDDRLAQYVARRVGDPPLVSVEFQFDERGWTISGWGDCRPRIVLDGLSQATWVLDPAAGLPGPEATTFTALVTETECTGGQAMGARLLPPSITYGEDSVLVVFAARPLDLGMATCPSNPPSRVVVELREPLGDRVLRDAGLFPPADPAAPPD